MTSGTEETNIITVVLDENNLNINIYGIYSSLEFTKGETADSQYSESLVVQFKSRKYDENPRST